MRQYMENIRKIKYNGYLSFSNDLNHGSRIQLHNVAVWNHMYDVLHFFNRLSRTHTTIYYDNFLEVSNPETFLN